MHSNNLLLWFCCINAKSVENSMNNLTMLLSLAVFWRMCCMLQSHITCQTYLENGKPPQQNTQLTQPNIAQALSIIYFTIGASLGESYFCYLTLPEFSLQGVQGSEFISFAQCGFFLSIVNQKHSPPDWVGKLLCAFSYSHHFWAVKSSKLQVTQCIPRAGLFRLKIK